MKKINSNIERDTMITKEFQSDGWIVLRFWEHEIRKVPETVISRIKSTIESVTSRSNPE
jgi:Protein of unknown function (DUF559).